MSGDEHRFFRGLINMLVLSSFMWLAVAAVAFGEDQISVKKAVTGLGEYQEVGGLLVLAEDSEPVIKHIGYLELDGEFSAASVIADDVDREVIPVEKIDEHTWVINGSGKVFVLATLVTQDPLSIEQRRFTVTIPGDEDEPDDPEDPDEPEEPEPESELVRDVRDWALAIDDPEGAQAISIVYRQIEAAVEDGAVRYDRAISAVKDATDEALAAIESKADWEPWRSKVTNVMVEWTQDGKLSNKAGVVELFGAVASGLELASSGSELTSFHTIVNIVEITNRVMRGQ